MRRRAWKDRLLLSLEARSLHTTPHSRLTASHVPATCQRTTVRLPPRLFGLATHVKKDEARTVKKDY